MSMYRIKRFIYEKLQDGIRNYLRWNARRIEQENARIARAEIRYQEKMEKLDLLRKTTFEYRRRTNIWWTEEQKKYSEDIQILKAYDNIRKKDTI